MARFWANRIHYDAASIDKVPAYWREDVRALIAERDKRMEA